MKCQCEIKQSAKQKICNFCHRELKCTSANKQHYFKDEVTEDLYLRIQSQFSLNTESSVEIDLCLASLFRSIGVTPKKLGHLLMLINHDDKDKIFNETKLKMALALGYLSEESYVYEDDFTRHQQGCYYALQSLYRLGFALNDVQQYF